VTTPVVLTLLGLSIGTLLAANRKASPRNSMTLRERAIEAQRLSAQTAKIARELTEQWSESERSPR
jgi:hypothetical protein